MWGTKSCSKGSLCIKILKIRGDKKILTKPLKEDKERPSSHVLRV